MKAGWAKRYDLMKKRQVRSWESKAQQTTFDPEAPAFWSEETRLIEWQGASVAELQEHNRLLLEDMLQRFGANRQE